MLNSSLCSIMSTKEHGRLIGSSDLFTVALCLWRFFPFFFWFSQFRIFFEISPSFFHFSFDTQTKKNKCLKKLHHHHHHHYHISLRVCLSVMTFVSGPGNQISLGAACSGWALKRWNRQQWGFPLLCRVWHSGDRQTLFLYYVHSSQTIYSKFL